VTQQHFTPRWKFTSTDLSTRENNEKREEFTNSVQNSDYYKMEYVCKQFVPSSTIGEFSASGEV
jgi:hypothetical protein